MTGVWVHVCTSCGQEPDYLLASVHEVMRSPGDNRRGAENRHHKTVSTTTKRLCKDCAVGWLSVRGLEDRVGPFLDAWGRTPGRHRSRGGK